MLMNDKLLRYADVMERTALSRTTIEREVRTGRLPVVRVGKSVRFREGDVDAYIAAHVVAGVQR